MGKRRSWLRICLLPFLLRVWSATLLHHSRFVAGQAVCFSLQEIKRWRKISVKVIGKYSAAQTFREVSREVVAAVIVGASSPCT